LNLLDRQQYPKKMRVENQYLVADTRRLPTIDDLCGELGCLPMFKGLDPGARREFASQIMSLRQQKDNPVAKKE